MVLSSFLIAFAASALACVAVIATGHIHGRYTNDEVSSQPQKFHERAVPRVGGAALFVGLAVGGAWFGVSGDGGLYMAKWAGLAALPVFLGGFFEDLTKRVTARDRLLLSFLSAAIVYYELGVQVTRLGSPWFDQNILTYPGVSLILTLVMIGGVAHSTNLIDGFHGLLGGFALLVLLSFSIVAHNLNDYSLFMYCIIFGGALLGVLVFNFPLGRIFFGDGGAYLTGFFLALFSVLLVKNSPMVSPWYPLTMLIYPVFETLFSIVRKTMWSNSSAMEPDQFHLHMLIHHSLHKKTKISRKWCNPTTSVVILASLAPKMVLATVFSSSTEVLIIIAVTFCVLYILVYRMLSVLCSDNLEDESVNL